jgi:hypothetical protein
MRARILWHSDSQETAVRSVETSRINQPATQRNNPGDQNPQPQRCSNLKPQTSPTTVSCHIYHEMRCPVNHTIPYVSFDYFVVLFTESTSGRHSFGTFRFQRPVMNPYHLLRNKNDITKHLQLQTYFTQMIRRKSNSTSIIHGVNSQNAAIIWTKQKNETGFHHGVTEIFF